MMIDGLGALISTLLRRFKSNLDFLFQSIPRLSDAIQKSNQTRILIRDRIFITPPSGARGGLKENGQNPDSGSKNSENQNNDAVS